MNGNKSLVFKGNVCYTRWKSQQIIIVYFYDTFTNMKPFKFDLMTLYLSSMVQSNMCNRNDLCHLVMFRNVAI